MHQCLLIDELGSGAHSSLVHQRFMDAENQECLLALHFHDISVSCLYVIGIIKVLIPDFAKYVVIYQV